MKRILCAALILVLILGLCGCEELDVYLEKFSDYLFASEYRDPSMQFTRPPAVTNPTIPAEEEEIEEPQRVFNNTDFVYILDYVPSAQIQLRYAGRNNFTGQQIYGFSEAFLRYGTVMKLKAAADMLAEQGYKLRVWDAFRPVSAQAELWRLYPNPAYIADPAYSHSSHSRGNTVDVTLLDEKGQPVVMPTDYMEFSLKADRDYSDCSDEARINALILQVAMESAGFKGYEAEWWHYTDTESYPVQSEFSPLAVQWYYANCNEFISLRVGPDASEEVLCNIQVNETFMVLAEYGDFFLVDYKGQQGYVMKSYAAPKS